MSDSDSDIDHGDFTWENLLDFDLTNYVLQLKWLKCWLNKLSDKITKKIATKEDYKFDPPLPFIEATSDQYFQNLLDFFQIQPLNETKTSWEMSRKDFPYPHAPASSKAYYLHHITKKNLPEKYEMFDLDFKNSIEQLKWLKTLIDNSAETIKIGSTPEQTSLVLPSNFDCGTESAPLFQLMLCLDFDPPFDDLKKSWTDPQRYRGAVEINLENQSIEPDDSIKKKSKFIQDLIYFNTESNRCKNCRLTFKVLLQHLNKDHTCRDAYDDCTLEDIKRKISREAKFMKQKWRERNKESIAKREAERYQQNKEEIRAKNKSVEKRSKNLKACAEYYQKNREKIRQTRALYYEKNKLKYAASYAEKIKPKILQAKKDAKTELNQKSFNKSKMNFKMDMTTHLKRAQKNYFGFVIINLTNLKTKTASFPDTIPPLSQIELDIKKFSEDWKQKINLAHENEALQSSTLEQINILKNRMELSMQNEMRSMNWKMAFTLRKICDQVGENYFCSDCEKRKTCSRCNNTFSDYELLRFHNIAENKKMLEKIKKDNLK